MVDPTSDIAVPRRICVVDDDEGIRDCLRMFFEDAGYDIEEAQDGTGALRFLESTAHPWVLLLDRSMPRMDGIEFIRTLIKRPDLRQRANIVIMTARGDPLDEETERLVGPHIFAHVNKPFHLDALLDTVERASAHLANSMLTE